MIALAAVALSSVAAWLLVVPAREQRVQRLVRGVRPSLIPRVRERLRSRLSGLALGPYARRRQARERTRVLHALRSLVSELEAGQPPTTALVRAAGEPSAWPHAERAARWGGDVAAAWELDARRAPVLGQVAACWRVGARGSGLAASLRTMGESARAAEDVRVEMEGQLAGPRATARMLAGLPVLGIGLGVLLGADPLAWLLGTPPGVACLVAGVALTAVGTWWTGRIAASVERRL